MAEASNSKSANDPQYYKNETTNYIAGVHFYHYRLNIFKFSNNNYSLY